MRDLVAAAAFITLFGAWIGPGLGVPAESALRLGVIGIGFAILLLSFTSEGDQ